MRDYYYNYYSHNYFDNIQTTVGGDRNERIVRP